MVPTPPGCESRDITVDAPPGNDRTDFEIASWQSRGWYLGDHWQISGSNQHTLQFIKCPDTPKGELKITTVPGGGAVQSFEVVYQEEELASLEESRRVEEALIEQPRKEAEEGEPWALLVGGLLLVIVLIAIMARR